MSNIYVSTRLARIFPSCAAAVLLVVISAVLFVEIQKRILRYRAEKLLSDVRSLTLRQSSFAQADEVRRKWHKWIKYEDRNDCNPARCDFGVFLQDLSLKHQQLFEHPWVSRIYDMVGGRATSIAMRLSVRDGLVWKKSIGVGIEVESYDVNGSVFPILLEGSASTAPRIDLAILNPAHTEYRIWTHDRNPNLNIEFNPYASTQDVKRLIEFDLSCISRRRRCTKPEELMPNAWRQLISESAVYNPGTNWAMCSPETIELLSRDAENAAIVSVIGHGNLVDSQLGKLHNVTIRLDERLKRATFWDIGATRTIALYPNDPLAGAVGTGWILLFQGGGIAQRLGLHFEACTPLPVNEKNLEIVRHGVAQDDRPADMVDFPRAVPAQPPAFR